jgi:3-phosphoshikimate 1-carboxyvinyltransferase
MIREFNKIEKVNGELKLPGDKSISHRSVMFSSMAKGTSKIYNLSDGEDVKSTQNCFKKLGAEVINCGDHIEIIGRGYKGFKKPEVNLDAGNSGTTTRLISGILIAQNFETIITGDASLSKRPMKRIITPLSLMGGKIKSTENYTLPLHIFPAEKIIPVKYELPVASAQVKSAVLLAGLHCENETSVIEKLPSRDHTERMLGLKTEYIEGKKISYVSKANYPSAKEYFVPSDFSTSAFFIVLALLSDNSVLRIKDVSLNKTRTGLLTVLKNMGGKIEIENQKEIAGESLGNIIVYSSKLQNVEITEEIIPNIIDEIPILSIAGVFAEGPFKVNKAAELRGKETDRIKALCYNLKLLGLKVNEYDDGFNISGDLKDEKATFESFEDHRIAMAFSVMSLLLKQGGKVNNFDCVNISNPNFLSQIKLIAR